MKVELFKVNIRQKVLVAIMVFLLGLGAMSYISYSNLREIEQKITLVEIADDLSNIVLEIRRTEKNLLLYGKEASLADNRRYIETALELLDSISEVLSQPSVERELGDLRQFIRSYGDTIKRIENDTERNELERASLVERLRESGKLLMEQSQAFARYERADILRINQRLRENLVYSAAVLVALGLGAFLFVTFKIVVPLRVIEQTTSSIAKGDFQPMPVWNTNDEIQRVMEALNHMVAELDKRRDQLVQAQKLSSIGTLASGIAHQLNNPLNNISTSCQILMEESRDESELAARMLSNIEQETLRARDIVRGLLEFSRQSEFSLGSYPLSQVVSRAVRLTSSQVPPGIETVVEVPGNLVVALDFQRIQEALINLILNAVQAIGEQPGEVRITARADALQHTVQLTVSDTGCGISEENRARIFDPFFSTKDVGLGTGLGLFVVYGIIKQHNGRIWVESEPGQGTAFHIELPLEQFDPEAPETAEGNTARPGREAAA
ncbi:MAG: sensor histidine kinase [Desulfovibrionaceae bacterium]